MNEHTQNVPPRCTFGRHPASVGAWTASVAVDITRAICATYEDEKGISHIDGGNMP